MKDFKGTKGKWSIEESYDSKYKQKIFNISTEEIEGLAVVFTGGENSHFFEAQKANAKLIASAPELLEALQIASKEISKYKSEHHVVGHLGKCEHVINQAINKALGDD